MGVRRRVGGLRGGVMIVERGDADAVVASSGEPLPEVASRLLAASEDRTQVRTVRGQHGIEFAVPLWLADAVMEAHNVAVARGESRPGSEPTPPRGNASAGAWAAFLDGQGIAVPDGATRNEMRALWRAHT